MLFSIAIIFLFGFILGEVARFCKLPPLLGMLIVGVVIGPHALNLLDGELLMISPELRKIALIIILTRAGLGLDLSELKKCGRTAVLMCFLPATIEIIGTVILAPLIFGISYVEAAVMGSVLAAVSPAVIVPKMLKLIDEKQGTNKGIPQIIMAGASVDDVFVIVLFTSFVALASGGEIHATDFARIPISIVFGILAGIILGILAAKFFKKVHLRDSLKIIILLSLAFVLVTVEDKLTGIITISGLIAVITVGIMLRRNHESLAKRLSDKYSKLWVPAEILLFVLVGAEVDAEYAYKYGISAILLIVGALIFRMIGVYLCTVKTNLSQKERLFTVISYCPKATVQAAIGAIPLSMGLECGELVLSVAVLAIIITAPLGAFMIELTYKKLTTKEG